MFVFFQCVAEAIAEQGLRGLADLTPGGAMVYDISVTAWEKYRKRCGESAQRLELERIAQANPDEIAQAAKESAKKAAKAKPGLLPDLELYLAEIPSSICQTLSRPADLTGKTIPPSFELGSASEFIKLLPKSLPRFRPNDPLPGKPDWRLDRKLGIGGFGEVWLARKVDFSKLTCAVKFFRCREQERQQLRYEADLVMQVSRGNPNVVPLQDIHLEGETPWAMFQYVEGGDLRDFIEFLRKLPIDRRQEQVRIALAKLAKAVGQFHRQSPAIVHRDLKPANILWDRKSKQLLITDFGIAGIAARHSALTQSYSIPYASPQQFNGALPDPRDDVHALGVIAYQMLMCRLDLGVGPDFARDLQELSIEPKFIELVGDSTAQKPERRPKDGAELAERVLKLPKSIPPDIVQDVEDYIHAFRLSKEDDFLKGKMARVPHWKEQAEKGCIPAVLLFGECLKSGVGLAQDTAAAREQYRKISQEDPIAAFWLGWMYAEGNGAPKDITEAALLLRKSAQRDVARAQYLLALMHQKGEGVGKDEKQAAELFQKAAEQGHRESQYSLARMYRDGIGIVQDLANAVKWLQLAAEAGDARAQNDLGCIYADGRGTKQDEAEAVKWFSMAAEQQLPQAEYNLGWMYYYKRGTEKAENDREMALTSFRSAASRGLETAATALERIEGPLHKRLFGLPSKLQSES